LIRYFVEKQSGRIGRTKLAWLIYLADLEARRYVGRPITDLRYRLSLQGPSDAVLGRCLDRLIDAEEISEHEVRRARGHGIVLRVVASLRPHPFTPGEETLLTYVLNAFGEMQPPEQLFDVVLASAPIRRSAKRALGTELPMECVDNEARIDLGGVDLERLLLAEDQARRGDVISLSELERRLSASPRSRRRKRGA
jgi:hypothetical protein